MALVQMNAGILHFTREDGSDRDLRTTRARVVEVRLWIPFGVVWRSERPEARAGWFSYVRGQNPPKATWVTLAEREVS